jgi:mono/diheme cytochrome c family protein
MRRLPFVILVMAFAGRCAGAATGFATPGDQDHQHNAGHSMSMPESSPSLPNPVPADALSLLEGRQVYERHCLSCHGPAGKGDGPAGGTLTPPPSDFTDGMWTHGSSDGEIFTLIRDGASHTAMRGYAGTLNTRELWSTVNYLRSIGPTHMHLH